MTDNIEIFIVYSFDQLSSDQDYVVFSERTNRFVLQQRQQITPDMIGSSSVEPTSPLSPMTHDTRLTSDVTRLRRACTNRRKLFFVCVLIVLLLAFAVTIAIVTLALIRYYSLAPDSFGPGHQMSPTSKDNQTTKHKTMQEFDFFRTLIVTPPAKVHCLATPFLDDHSLFNRQLVSLADARGSPHNLYSANPQITTQHLRTGHRWKLKLVNVKLKPTKLKLEK